MNGFKKCPECGRDMTWGMRYNCGSIVVFWKCFCGYLEDECGYKCDNKTTCPTDRRRDSDTN